MLERAVRDVGMHYYKRRLFSLYPCFLKRKGYGYRILAIFNIYDLPAHSREPAGYVFGKGDIGRTFYGYAVAVIYGYELVQLLRACKACSFISALSLSAGFM